MEIFLVLLIVAAFVGLAIKKGSDQLKADRAEGVVATCGRWRVTPTEFLVGLKNDTCVRHPLAGLDASFDMSGDISRDSGRYTMTRFALLGPFALAAKKGRNKKIDDREGYLTVVGRDGVALLQTVRGPQFGAAKQFQIKFNQLALAAAAQQHRAPLAPPASPQLPAALVWPVPPSEPLQSRPGSVNYSGRMGLRRPPQQ
ncbi:hypothetical protein [Amycolatopsis thermoflava]|uniref:Uncharacterized protein n=1 Tax=Amycolatopsis thermoflava TaxID=84480 RepID=A0A3N2GPC5_9PSEU|nr:hypothetical protein [Amycolatopsis thermoflava]ROS38484.1 hypothetical protein EDD35_0763 [Amycolatopsis thermoflava]